MAVPVYDTPLMSMPFRKGRKLWIEIEATEDGDMTDPINFDLSALVFQGKQLGQFKVNQLVLFESYFGKQLAHDIRKLLIDKGYQP